MNCKGRICEVLEVLFAAQMANQYFVNFRVSLIVLRVS